MKTIIYLIIILCCFGGTIKAQDNRTDIVEYKASFLKWFRNLPQKESSKVISAQFVSWGKNTTLNELDSIYKKSGVHPAAVGIDYFCLSMEVANPQPALAIEIKTPNQLVKEYGTKLCFMSMHLNNPMDDGAAWHNNGDLKQLFSDKGKLRKFNALLDTVAYGIADLQASNILVFLRPYHEMNGSWFWWGSKDTTLYKQLWMYTYDRFTKKHKLKNIIWGYSPIVWGKNYLAYYPGDNFVDVVCADAYGEWAGQGYKQAYDSLKTTKKPIGLGEFGICEGDDWHWKNKEVKDYTPLLSALRNNPETRFFLTWNYNWGMAYHKNIKEVMTDKIIINKENLYLCGFNLK